MTAVSELVERCYLDVHGALSTDASLMPFERANLAQALSSLWAVAVGHGLDDMLPPPMDAAIAGLPLVQVEAVR